jgi:hypothetical protein
LERLGADLDIRSDFLGCDPESVRRAVLEQADLSSSGPLSEGLVAYLLDPPSASTPQQDPDPSTESVSTSDG